MPKKLLSSLINVPFYLGVFLHSQNRVPDKKLEYVVARGDSDGEKIAAQQKRIMGPHEIDVFKAPMGLDRPAIPAGSENSSSRRGEVQAC